MCFFPLAVGLMWIVLQVIEMFVFIKNRLRTSLLEPCNSGYCRHRVNRVVFDGATGRCWALIITEMIVKLNLESNIGRVH